jgi:putative (di)nucleoside polyphosphate hydrolase
VLLADPEVRLLMHADKVDETDLLRMLRDVSIQLRSWHSGVDPPDRERARAGDTRKYRRGVGIMLINTRCEIFLARRNDVSGDAWQMPQGGVDRGETPREAAYRELREEIGTDNVEVIAQSRDWLYYDLPEEIVTKVWGGRWKGQRQKWFLMLFRGTDAEINLATTAHPEFDSWRWASIDELETLVISFKKMLYLSVIDQFREILNAKRGLLDGCENPVARMPP